MLSEAEGLKLNLGGKSYYPSVIDKLGNLHLFIGYGD